MAGRAGCRRPSALISKTAAGAEQPGNQTNETMTTTIRNQGPDRRLDGHPARGAGVLRLDAELLAAMDPPTPKERRLPIKVAQALTAYPLQKQKRLWERFRTKGAASAFHHVRAAAPTQRAGGAGYDGQFVVRRVKMAAGICASVAALPSGMLGRLTREKRKQVAAELRALAEKALVLAALFDAMQESQPEEDEE